MKSALERFLALFLLIVLLPILIILGIVTFTDSSGPVIFRQRRVGYKGKHFTVYKFRTMYDKPWSVVNISGNDKRVTSSGRFLRRTHFDELPQFWNIVRGQMSFVGPRPQVPELVDLYDSLYPLRYRRRLMLLPGLTGLPQIMGEKLGAHNLFKAIALDELYRQKKNIWLDIKIFLLTIVKVLKASSY